MILIDGQVPEKEKAASFTFDTIKKSFRNSQNVELTPKDFQMLTGSLGGDFSLWCVFSPRQAGSFETVILPDDEILKSRGGVM